MVNNDISGRAARLIDNDQSSTVRNEESDWRSQSALSKRSPMMYMNQQAVANYDAIKK